MTAPELESLRRRPSERVRMQCRAIADNARLVTGAARTILVLYEESTNRLFGAAMTSANVPLQEVAFDLIRRNYPDRNPFEFSYPPNVNPAVAAAFIGQRTQVNTLAEAFENILPESVMAIAHGLAGITHVVSCPVLSEGRALGLIRFLVNGSPTDEQQALMEAAAAQIGLTLANAELVEQTRRQLAAIQAMEEVARVAVGSDIQRTLDALVQRVRELTEADAAVVYLIEPDGRNFAGVAESLTTAAQEADLYRVGQASRKIGFGLVGWVIAAGEAAFVPDLRLDPRSTTRRISTQPEAVIMVPMRLSGRRTIGCLRLSIIGRGRRFIESDLGLAQTLADEAAYAVESKREQDRAQAAAYRTGAEVTAGKVKSVVPAVLELLEDLRQDGVSANGHAAQLEEARNSLNQLLADLRVEAKDCAIAQPGRPSGWT
jgi:GAF domain-containing protein